MALKELTIEKIKPKSFEKKEETEKFKEPIVEYTGRSKMRTEHPVLADLYMDLNEAISKLSKLNGRSRDLTRLAENEVQAIKKKIDTYTKENSITREDHIRWNS